MIVGVGVDVVDVARFAGSLRRTPALAPRLLTAAEREGRPAESLAARFAAKEALAKALGAPPGLAWRDAEVSTTGAGRPGLVVRGTVAAAAERLGASRAHLSLSHDGGCALAFVVLEDG